MILADYKIRGGKFHVAGPSNGGIAAMHVAGAYPQYFISVTAFPGYMWQPSRAKLDAISKLCVFLYVGELDEYHWHDEMKREAEYLSSKGTLARYTVEQGQPHRLATLAGEHAGRLFDGFEEASPVAGEVLVEQDVAFPVLNAEIEGAGVQVDPAVVLMLASIEAHGSPPGLDVRSLSTFCLPTSR